MKTLLALLALLLPLPLAVPPASGQPLPEIPTITVPPAGAAVTGKLGPGGRNLYYVSAQSLQALAVTLTSAGNLAVFQVYGPGALVAPGSDGVPAITGTTLTDAGAKDAPLAWMGVVPQSGLCLIAVDSKAGPTIYTLSIQLQ
ncbi:MAG: hypothetical protein Q8L22_06070 [Reyranella sp.]|nr:hypothetical protein [Reyranella sp.]